MNASDISIDYGSVCSGIEAATVAWQPLGFTPAWYSEIAPFPSAVLAHHYPHTPNLGDMTLIADRVLNGSVRAPEVLVGGTPCQSFSVAGARRGLRDERGALTLKYVELANAIDKVRTQQTQPPTVLVWENVPGVLSDRSNAFGCFLGAVAGEEHALHPPGQRWTHAGCVYGPQRAVAWRVLDAQYFSLAQRRARVFLIASARTDIDPLAILFDDEGLRRNSPPREEARQDTAALASSGVAGESRATPGSASGDEDALPSVACFGGGNTSGSITHATCLNSCGYRCDFDVETYAVHGFGGRVSHSLDTANNGKGSSEDGTGRGIPVVTHTLTCASAVTEDGEGRGLPMVTMQYRLNGISVHADPTAAAFAQNSRGEIRWEGGDGQRIGVMSAGGGIPGQGVPTVAALEAHFECRPVKDADPTRPEWWQQWHVRRLMPVECERLQGLPDNYTLVPYRGAPAADGPRYAAIGNSMAIPCVSWVGRQLRRALRVRRNADALRRPRDRGSKCGTR